MGKFLSVLFIFLLAISCSEDEVQVDYIVLPGATTDTGDGNGDGNEPPPPGNETPPPGDTTPPPSDIGDILTPAKPFPIENFASSHFRSNQDCIRCHNGMQDEQGNDVSIQKAWSSTMMAHATIDPLWQAKVRSEIKRNPQLETVINDKCSRCHAPMANVEAKHVGYEISIFAGGILSPNHALYDLGREGVSCTLCHQVKDTPELGTLAGVSGKFTIESFTNPADRVIYGPFDNVNTGPMRNNVQYNIQYSNHIKQSKMCATCHDLKTPFVNKDGVLVSTTPETEFPEQMIYSEWEASSFKNVKSCQDCHMTRTRAPIATRPRGLTSRDGFAQHIFVGGNVMMLDLLKRNGTELGANTSNIDFTLAKTQDMLNSAASLSIMNPVLVGNELRFDVKIVNESGHKLPSGFPSRRVFLHTQVFNAQDQLVFESGKSNNDGSIVGANADQDTKQFEGHHNIIDSPDKVQIYEAVMQNVEGEVTYTLLRGSTYAKDNRLLPQGFDKTSVQDDIKVYGDANNDSNFTAGEDTVSYHVKGITNLTGMRISVSLKYQSVGFAFAQDLFLDNTTQSNTFKRMYTPSQLKSVEMSTVNYDL